MWVVRLGAGDQNAITGLSGPSSSRRLRMGESSYQSGVLVAIESSGVLMC